MDSPIRATGALGGWCGLREPLWTLCPRVLSPADNKRVTAPRHFEFLPYEMRADDPSPCPPRDRTPRVGLEQVAHRAGSYVACPQPGSDWWNPIYGRLIGQNRSPDRSQPIVAKPLLT